MEDKDLIKFFQLCNDQFAYGGQKYAATSTKEATDHLFDDFGLGWLLGTCGKYCKRFKNTKREKDPLKIATYMYLIWLKKGFHIHAEGLKSDALYTTVDVKAKYFEEFRKRCSEYIAYREISKANAIINPKDDLNQLYWNLKTWNKCGWSYITDREIYSCFLDCYLVWKTHFANIAGQDIDTWNEGK